ncbi:MAG: tRNA (adenosine(37)-N6)-threonylcarbamoyltransferase complex ATPase subunit type 1 TsaE [Kiritimatiellae bacterium]|jgi:tRNA threonylcarbamoyl adenosine modification protein YjeE|nr:tRNA (adenosine(37)-N6)-threonylcarbamoyltransferase complex ATPase subunit type 1 TsaE [Kiritimatiellia bacterium]
MQNIYNVKSVEESWAVAAEVVKLLKPGTVMALHGDLGAGKTTFMQGIAIALHLERPVTSPTFTLSNEYNAAQFKLVHMDLYRLTSPDDLLAIGYAEHIENGAVVAVEWPERAEDLIPADAIHIYLEQGDEMEDRRIIVEQP